MQAGSAQARARAVLAQWPKRAFSRCSAFMVCGVPLIHFGAALVHAHALCSLNLVQDRLEPFILPLQNEVEGRPNMFVGNSGLF